jgi:hypothetical protein
LQEWVWEDLRPKMNGETCLLFTFSRTQVTGQGIVLVDRD